MTSYFAAVVDFVGAHPHYALAAVFVLALSEAIPFVGTAVPGSTLIIGTHGSCLLLPWREPFPEMVCRSGSDSGITGRFFWAGR